MPSQRLYYDDSYTTRFAARVTDATARGERPAIELDATYFYPESGGQEADRGTLGGVPVLDVQSDESGRVWHTLETNPEGSELEAVIDWSRRFDHMQQHTGQHILSAAFERVLAAPTLSSTLGTEKSSIEVALNDVDWRILEKLEESANQIVWDDRPLAFHWVDEEGAKRFALRKPPPAHDRIRIVEIPEWDLSACGGTHTRRTGEVGVIKVTRWEKVRGNLRFEFLCGARALRDHAWRTEALLEAARRRTLKDRELIGHLERAAAERDELRKRLDVLTARMIESEARERVGAPGRAVEHFDAERPREEVRRLALQCLQAGAPWVVVGAAAPDAVLVLGRAKSGTTDLRVLLPGLLERTRGKGGGAPDFIQVAAADAPAAEAAWRWAIEAVRLAAEGSA
jgi:alanyl-tRNA synthetase